MFLLAAGLLLSGGVALYRANLVERTNPGQDAVRVGQQMVRESLDEGLRAAFSSEEETVVETLPDARVRVSGWVDLMTEGGQSDRQNFSIVVYKNEAGDWAGEKLSVIPQM